MLRLCVFITVLGLLTCISSPVLSASDDILDSAGKRQVDIKNIPQWQRILELYQNDMPTFVRCAEMGPHCPWKRVAGWQNFVNDIRHDAPLDQINKVNMWLNNQPYKQDNWVYGKSDYWTSLREFLEHSGDCEDFAIAKYITLRQLGFQSEQMQVAIVYDVYSGTDHAFLTVDYGGHTYILDNREKTITPAGHAKRYRPLFTFNEYDLWVYDQPVMARTMRDDSVTILPGNR